ncbi:MAG: hypothetical protein ABR613_02975 [Actinomycetota bacterium]
MADAASNRLIGLTRTDPTSHDSGAFVAAPMTEATSVVPEPVAPVTTPPPDATVMGAVESPLECGDDGCGNDGTEELVGLVCDAGACDAAQDPLGPWSACDLDNADEARETCPDPDDVVDLAWEMDAELSDLECEASVSGPRISAGGGMVVGRGTFECGEFVSFVEIKVCLHRAVAGAWTKMGCREKKKIISEGGVWGDASKKIAEPCTKQQTAVYRIRVRGHAVDGGGPNQIDEERDTAKATAELYCPGMSVDGASADAIEYAESWLPTEE